MEIDMFTIIYHISHQEKINKIQMNFTIISYIEILTFLMAIIFLKKRNNGLLFSILLLNAAAETFFSFNNSLVEITVLYCYIHFVLWFFLLFKMVKKEKALRYIIPLYSIFCLLDFLYIEGAKSLNYYSFVLGTFIYVFSFIVFSFQNLKKEDFNFFLSNNYIILSSPVLFFIGMSLLFAFDTSALFHIKVINDINLYVIICYFVNIIYYFLINCYIYRENRGYV